MISGEINLYPETTSGTKTPALQQYDLALEYIKDRIKYAESLGFVEGAQVKLTQGNLGVIIRIVNNYSTAFNDFNTEPNILGVRFTERATGYTSWRNLSIDDVTLIGDNLAKDE